ncbi:reverse transcriptase domain-containing protein [Tanacetum coccineum]
MFKSLLSNKEKLLELANTPLNEICSAVILKKLLEKLGDPGKFLISYGFSELKCKALANLGASINLMPLSVWKKLGLPELISTRMTLKLANRAICTPAGIARDVFVPVRKFTFPANFVIVDYESDPRVPLILGRTFLRTARALIDVHREEMILRDGDERLILNMRHDTSSYSNKPKKESINMIDIYNVSHKYYLEDLFTNEKRTNHQSGNPTFSSHIDLTSSEVINLLSGNPTPISGIVLVPHTSQENGIIVTKMSTPATAKEKTNKKNDVKARGLLLMALPNEHQLTFSPYPDAKSMFTAIKTRFGGLGVTTVIRTMKNIVQRPMLAIDGVGYDSSDMQMKHGDQAMTGNIAYLSDFKEFDRGYVAFGGGAYGGRITWHVFECKSDEGFLENKPMIQGTGLKWLFDIDSLTQSMNYVPVTTGIISNDSAGTSEENSQDCIVMPIWKDTSYFDSPTKDVDNGETKTADDARKQVEDGLNNENAIQERFADDSSTKDVNAVGQQVNTASPDVNTGSLKLNVVGPSVSTASPNEEDSTEEEPEVDLGNIINSYIVSTTPNTRIHKDHPIDNVIGKVQSTVQTRRMSKPTYEQGFLSDVYEQKTHDTLNTCLYTCFLSQIEPTSIAKALSDSSWVEAMQEELLQFKLQQVWIQVYLPNGKKAIGTKWVFKNKKDKRGIVIRNKARLLAERLQSKEREEVTDGEKVKLFIELMEKEENILLHLKHKKRETDLLPKHKRELKCLLILSTWESKEKKEEGREETTKGSRKKMLRRKRVGKEQQQESLKKQKVEKEKESDKVDEFDEAELKKLLVIKRGYDGTLSVDKSRWKFQEILFNDKNAIRNRQRRLGSSLEDSEGKEWVTIWKLIDSSGVHFCRLHGFLEVAAAQSPHLGKTLYYRQLCALIDVHGEEMILRDGDKRLILNKRHDTSSYYNKPKKESINRIDIYNVSHEDYLEDLFANEKITNNQSGNPTFSSYTDLTSPEVIIHGVAKSYSDFGTRRPIDNVDVYNDPFDSKEDKIKESKLLIDELDLPRSSDFLPSPECESVLYEDFSEVDALPSANN